MIARIVSLAVLLTVGMWLHPREATAQTSAVAQALFDEALSLRKAGKLDEACAKFEESLRLDAAVSTRFNVADCFERQGRLASAWSQFLQVAADLQRDGDEVRGDAARARAKRLEPRLSKMVIKTSAPPEGLVVKRDGVEVGEAQWSTALPVDAGAHELEASAPGKIRWSQTVTVKGEGQLVTVNIPALEDAPAGWAPPPSSSLPPRADVVLPPPPPGPSSTPMIAGLTLGAIGLAGIGIGTALGVIAIGKKGDVDDICPDLNNCTEEGIDTNDEAKTAATASTVAFIAGGALLATGIVLWIALPSEPSREVGFELTPSRLSFAARF